jgi:hypothetical protein
LLYLHCYLKWKIKQLSNVHKQGDKPNIFIFTTARSGSTWLMEMLSSQKGVKYIHEPLLMTQFNNGPLSPLPPSWDFVLPHPGQERVLKQYFEKLIHNRIGVGAPPPFSKYHRWISRRIVFKILRCKDLMNWFEEEFDAQIVYLVRHPISNAISRVKYSRLQLFLSNELYCKRYLTPKLRSYCLDVAQQGTELQKKVLDWCLQNLPPLKHLDRTHWFCITYEELITRPHEIIANLAKTLDLDEPQKIIERVGMPSTSVLLSDKATKHFLEQTSGEDDRTYLLSKWREKVSEEEEHQVFEIMQRFGLDLYRFGHDLPVSSL